MLRLGLLAAVLGTAGTAAAEGPEERDRTLTATALGVVPDDGLDDAHSIATALREARRRGASTLILPAGRYHVGGEILVPSGVAILGQGCGQTVLERLPSAAGQMMFRLDGARDVTIRGLSFEHASAPPFYRSIGFRGEGSHDVLITENCFSDARPLAGGGDRWAVELSALDSPSSQVTIARNRVSGKLQLTAGGGMGVIGLSIANNRIEGAKANAIGVSTLAEGALFRDITVRGNLILDTLAIGIFIGPDQPVAGGGHFERVLIEDNMIAGFSHRFAHGILVRAPAGNLEGLRIGGNRIDGAGSAKITGIRILDDHGEDQRRLRWVMICGNELRNVSRGIWLSSVDQAVIARNSVHSARPLLADPLENTGVQIIQSEAAC